MRRPGSRWVSGGVSLGSFCCAVAAFAADPEKSVVQIIGFIQPPSWEAPWRFDPVHRAGGSGFVIKTGKGKRVMTNAHVISWARQIIVRRYQDPRQYVEDYASGNVRLSQMLASCSFFLYSNLAEAGLGLGSAMRWAYDAFQKVRGGTPYPTRIGKIRKGARTPAARTNLRPGELVRIKSYREILETLDEDWHNRGMYFDPEMVPFCGKTFRVLKRVQPRAVDPTGDGRY